MTVIAMTREMGTLGRDVAVRLADEMGLRLVQHEIVGHVADKMHMRESQVNRFLEGRAGLLERWGIRENRLSLFTAEEILDLAEGDDVLIRGWGATHVLREIPHVLCVRVCAPVSFRVAEMKLRLGITDDKLAQTEIEKSDAAHAKVMYQLNGANFGDPLGYDIVLNTGQLSVDQCADTIRGLVEHPSMQRTELSQRKLMAATLKAHIVSALIENDTTNSPSNHVNVQVNPESCAVKLSGIVYDHGALTELDRVVGAVPGVTTVNNEVTAADFALVGI